MTVNKETEDPMARAERERLEITLRRARTLLRARNEEVPIRERIAAHAVVMGYLEGKVKDQAGLKKLKNQMLLEGLGIPSLYLRNLARGAGARVEENLEVGRRAYRVMQGLKKEE